MVDPVTAALAVKHVYDLGRYTHKLWKAYKRFDEGDPEAVEKMRAKVDEQWIVDLDTAFRRLDAAVEDGSERANAMDARLALLEDDDETLRHLLLGLKYEAVRESLASRRQLLAEAAAALLMADLPIEAKARFERTLRFLDPTDVMTLYGASIAAGYHFKGEAFLGPANALAAALEHSPSRDILEAAGCFRVTTSTGFAGDGLNNASDALQITSIGRLVLDVLRAYTRARRREIPFLVPGWEESPGSRSEHDARAVIDKHAQLVTLLGELPASVEKRYDRPTWSQGHRKMVGSEERIQWLPAKHNAAGRLRFDLVPVELRNQLAETYPQATATSFMIGYDADDRFEVVYQPGRDGAWMVDVWGPDDVLRWLADDLDARRY